MVRPELYRIWDIFLAGLLSIWASRERAVNLGMGSPIGSPGQWLCPNNCRIALNTLVKIQTMVVKIINTIVEISNSQMLKYAGHSKRRGVGLVNICFFQRERRLSSIHLSEEEGFQEISFKSEIADRILERDCTGNRQRVS